VEAIQDCAEFVLATTEKSEKFHNGWGVRKIPWSDRGAGRQDKVIILLLTTRLVQSFFSLLRVVANDCDRALYECHFRFKDARIKHFRMYLLKDLRKIQRGNRSPCCNLNSIGMR
jgi:hypothetical protein